MGSDRKNGAIADLANRTSIDGLIMCSWQFAPSRLPMKSFVPCSAHNNGYRQRVLRRAQLLVQ